MGARVTMNGDMSMPVTDPAVMQDAINEVMGTVQAIRAHTLLAASRDVNDFDAATGFVPADPDAADPADAEARRDAAADATFEREMQRLSTGGQPASSSMS
jgi:hypothetical protein